MKQIKWELDREQIFKQRDRRLQRNIKKTSRRKPKLTRREKRRKLHQEKITKVNKRVRFNRTVGFSKK